jgi:hypothetical protein
MIAASAYSAPNNSSRPAYLMRKSSLTALEVLLTAWQGCRNPLHHIGRSPLPGALTTTTLIAAGKPSSNTRMPTPPPPTSTSHTDPYAAIRLYIVPSGVLRGPKGALRGPKYPWCHAEEPTPPV